LRVGEFGLSLDNEIMNSSPRRKRNREPRPAACTRSDWAGPEKLQRRTGSLEGNLAPVGSTRGKHRIRIADRPPQEILRKRDVLDTLDMSHAATPGKKCRNANSQTASQ
jgi:hypothetical protein